MLGLVQFNYATTRRFGKTLWGEMWRTRSMPHLIRNSAVSFICSSALALFFGWINLDQYTGYLHAPPFPFQYVITTPCFVIVAAAGACIGSYTYLALPATLDFVLWFAGIFGGMLGIVTLLTASDSRVKRLAGVAIVGAILFGIFVPVTETASYRVCSPPPSYCGSVAQYASLSYVYLGTGAMYATSGNYWIGVANSG